jgi:hypothetical protein
MNHLSKFRIPNYGPLGGVNELHGLFDLIKEHFDKHSNICEIGTYLGVSSELFALCCEDIISVDKRKLDGLEDVLLRNDNFKFMNMTSEEASSHFEDGFFDGVYIDARHEYEYVKQDIELWLPKVKPGGVLCGHDYITDEIAAIPSELDWFGQKMGHGGVKKAVDKKFADVKTYKDSSWAVKV